MITEKQFWISAAYRALRTFIQVILAVWTAGQLITEVDWRFLLLSAFSSAVYSLLTSIVSGLPEVEYRQALEQLEEIRPVPVTDDFEDYDEVGIPESEDDE